MGDLTRHFAHTTAEIDAAVDKTNETYTSAETDTLLAEKADQSDVETLSGNTESLSETLKSVIDTGPKNRIILGFPATTKSGVTATPNDDGTITISGTNSSSSSTILVFDLWGNASASTDNKQDPFTEEGEYIFTGSGSNSVRVQLYGYNDDLQLNVIANSSSSVEFTVDGTYKYYVFRIWIAGSASFDDLVLSPMCCLKDLYDISPDFKPYVPTNEELYAMIKALQPGASLQSVSLQRMDAAVIENATEDITGDVAEGGVQEAENER